MILAYRVIKPTRHILDPYFGFIVEISVKPFVGKIRTHQFLDTVFQHITYRQCYK